MTLSNDLSCEAGSFSCCRPNPHGVFNLRFEALFPRAGALGCVVCFAPLPFLPVYLCVNVGLQGLPAAARPALFHNPPPCWVYQLPPCCESSPPGCPSPPLLLGWMNVSSLSPWLSDFHTAPFSVSSGWFLFLNCCPSFGCARRHSVSTPASWPEALKTESLELSV